MSDEQEPQEPNTDDALTQLAAALGQDEDKMRRELERQRVIWKELPEHAKALSLRSEMSMINMFLMKYLPSQGVTLARYDEDGNLHQFQESPETTASPLVPTFFGIDYAKFTEEEPKMQALSHQWDSEDAVERHDPVIDDQIREFENMLAGMGTEESDQ